MGVVCGFVFDGWNHTEGALEAVVVAARHPVLGGLRRQPGPARVRNGRRRCRYIWPCTGQYSPPQARHRHRPRCSPCKESYCRPKHPVVLLEAVDPGAQRLDLIPLRRAQRARTGPVRDLPAQPGPFGSPSRPGTAAHAAVSESYAPNSSFTIWAPAPSPRRHTSRHTCMLLGEKGCATISRTLQCKRVQ